MGGDDYVCGEHAKRAKILKEATSSDPSKGVGG